MWVQLTVACAGVEHFLGRHDLAQKRLAEALDRAARPGDSRGRGSDARTGGRRHVPHGLRLHPHVGGASPRCRSTAPGRAAHQRPRAPWWSLGGACSGEIAEGRGAATRDRCARSTECPTRTWLAARTQPGILRPPSSNSTASPTRLHTPSAGLEIVRATGQIAPTLVPTLGTARFMRGLLSESAVLLDAGLETARLTGVDQAIAWSLVNRSMSALAAGQVETALSTAEEAIELTHGLDERWISGWAGVAHAGALLAVDEPARAAASLLRRVRWPGAAVRPGWVEANGPRTAHALPTGAWRSRRGTRNRGARRRHRRRRGPADDRGVG